MSELGTLERLEAPDSIAQEWEALSARAGPSFFLTWGWIGPWASEMASRTPLYVFRLRRDGATIALAVLTRHRTKRRKGLIRPLQLQLNEHTAPGCDMIIEHNGLLCAAEDILGAWQAFAAVIERAPFSWDEIKVRSLVPDQLAAARSSLSFLRVENDRALPAWVVKLDEACITTDGLLAEFKKKTRQQMRQSLREFDSIGPLKLEIALDSGEGGRYFEEMERFHGARWQRVGKRGSFANEAWVRFHSRVIRDGIGRGDVILARVSAGEDAIGIVYGYVRESSFYALQTGFKPQDRAALRSGYVTHFLLMQALASRGIRAYDFLPDEEGSYKRLLAEPAELLTTLRAQRPRLIFRAERAAVALHSFLHRRPPTALPAPIEEEAS